ncbi:MAG: valine--tRNA ligase [Cytophagales bacterium]|nr:MAG: valine--tRNA ligase [Cytophagales bacterium]TAF60583.1 MAG: valine--tRNA ligase [Cytophagales bacterium]
MSSEISKVYQPQEVEKKWYAHWLKHKFYEAKPNANKKPYTILMPPPNVTGILHMGHILNNTIQDVLVRRARMKGFEALWVPGTDHASIATEAKVVRMLREQNIRKADLTREQFLEHAWEWKEKYGGIILKQLTVLGASCDWSRTRFTLEPSYYRAVIKVFIDFYKKGHIYRGLRMINWDCEAQTALSNEEVIYKEDGERSTLYSIRYALKEGDGYMVIATQRPETIMGDVAIAVNPTDERYKHLVGKKALVPFINREIPIIADDYVDKEFGTGCLKVTPAHDINDYEIGLRHKLEVIDTINANGTMSELCQMPEFVGKDRFEVRKRIVKKLEAEGFIVEAKEFVTRIGRSERTNTVVEPKLSLQWFINMQTISKPALEAVEQDLVRLHPPKFKNTYRHWMENVKDWCISRQLWWGQRIPAYYLPNGEFVVAESAEEALLMAQKINPAYTAQDLTQDQDVLDTWASAWLWPMAVFDAYEDFNLKKSDFDAINKDLAYFYPSDVLVTAPEILFFWVARMIIAGQEYMKKPPFQDVYLTGIVRDKQGRKMSKQLGNSPDPIDLIGQYGADGVRVGMLFCSPAGNDLPFDEKLCEQGRNFANKIWNAFRLIKGWEVDAEAKPANRKAISWFEAKLNQVLTNIEDLYEQFRLSEALMAIYKLVWDDFCSWYLEMVKPEAGEDIDPETLQKTKDFMETLLKLLHPFMPFITEEIWSLLSERDEKDCITVSAYPQVKPFETQILGQAEVALELVSQVRNFRSRHGLSPKLEFDIEILSGYNTPYVEFAAEIMKLANLSGLTFPDQKSKFPLSFVIGQDEFFVQIELQKDLEKERENLHKEIAYHKGFLESVLKKLNNERFVQNAKPEVIASEQKKKADAEAKIKALEEGLMALQ